MNARKQLYNDSLHSIESFLEMCKNNEPESNPAESAVVLLGKCINSLAKHYSEIGIEQLGEYTVMDCLSLTLNVFKEIIDDNHAEFLSLDILTHVNEGDSR